MFVAHMMDGQPPRARGPARDGDAEAEEAQVQVRRAPARGLIGAHAARAPTSMGHAGRALHAPRTLSALNLKRLSPLSTITY